MVFFLRCGIAYYPVMEGSVDEALSSSIDYTLVQRICAPAKIFESTIRNVERVVLGYVTKELYENLVGGYAGRVIYAIEPFVFREEILVDVYRGASIGFELGNLRDFKSSNHFNIVNCQLTFKIRTSFAQRVKMVIERDLRVNNEKLGSFHFSAGFAFAVQSHRIAFNSNFEVDNYSEFVVSLNFVYSMQFSKKFFVSILGTNRLSVVVEKKYLLLESDLLCVASFFGNAYMRCSCGESSGLMKVCDHVDSQEECYGCDNRIIVFLLHIYSRFQYNVVEIQIMKSMLSHLQKIVELVGKCVVSDDFLSVVFPLEYKDYDWRQIWYNCFSLCLIWNNKIFRMEKRSGPLYHFFPPGDLSGSIFRITETISGYSATIVDCPFVIGMKSVVESCTTAVLEARVCELQGDSFLEFKL